MEIKKANLTWARPLTKIDPNGLIAIALHHLDHPTWTVFDVHEFHKRPVEQGGRGWKGNAYHYQVDKDGTVWEVRGYEYEGGGLTGTTLNRTVLSIAFQGAYHDKDKEMPETQFRAGVELLRYLKTQLPNVKTIAGHKHWESTSCPGQYFPLEKMINAVDEAVFIMGEPDLTVEQMRKFLREINPNAPQGIEEIYLEEGKAEGVRGDIAFCQAIKETDYFRFTGLAKIEWCNPAGLGVTGQIVNGEPVGCKFPDWRTGIRAQIQHLKAYAVKNPTFKNPLVDPRYEAVKKAGYIGTAPLWTDLNGKWAYPGKTYGQSILKLFDRVKSIQIDSDSEIIKLLNKDIERLRNENKRLQDIIEKIKEAVKGE
jgi:hypothetical protein